MAAVQSTMQLLGSTAADFSLPNVSNSQTVSLSDLQAKPLLVMFICNHCPFVIHIAERMTELGNKALDDGFAVVAISSNDIENYPQDGPDQMADFAAQYGFKFPYLYDESQAVAKAYGAACTPDFFIYNAKNELVYRGQMDDARPSNSIDVSGDDLSKGLRSVTLGVAVSEEQMPSIGCNIKWKPGNEPGYF